MKALSLKQPWAELVVSGRKTIETRKWNTKFRGEFLIHASQNTNKERCREFGIDGLPRGCIVGRATLVEVKRYDTAEQFLADASRHLAKTVIWPFPCYGFLLQNAARLEHVPLKGKLNFFDAEPPAAKALYKEQPLKDAWPKQSC